VIPEVDTNDLSQGLIDLDSMPGSAVIDAVVNQIGNPIIHGCT
jgi:hypothetical protein